MIDFVLYLILFYAIIIFMSAMDILKEVKRNRKAIHALNNKNIRNDFTEIDNGK